MAPQVELPGAASHGLSNASCTHAGRGHATPMDQGSCWRFGGSAGSAVEGGDVDAWIKLGVENKSSWKQLVKPVLIHIGSPALGTAEMVQSPDCHKSFLVKGLGHGCTTYSELPGPWWTGTASARCAGSSFTRGKG